MPERSTTYIRVEWHHSLPDEPIVLYSELDEERWERRKVYLFRNGSPGYASETEATRTVWLGEAAVPPLEEIAAQPEFEPREISKEEFQQVWSEALRQSPHSEIHGFTIPHLVVEFLELDCDATVHSMLLSEINEHGKAKADIYRYFTFNQFNVRLDFLNQRVTVEDALNVSEHSAFTISLTAFTTILNNRNG